MLSIQLPSDTIEALTAELVEKESNIRDYKQENQILSDLIEDFREENQRLKQELKQLKGDK